jgi:hypothetical protein
VIDLNVLFYGNCQTQTALTAVGISNPGVNFEYAGNSRRVERYDPEITEKLFDWCDYVVTQPVMNLDNPDHHATMSARFAGKIIFMPYVWVDGLYSLVAAPGGKEKRGDSGFHGGNCVIEHLQEAGLTDTLNDFQNGALNFRHQSRFDASMAELERREDFADVKVAPFIRERFRDEPMQGR